MSARPGSPLRKRQVLAGLACGLGAEGIAACLGLSSQTVRGYIKDMYEELGAHTSGQAVAVGFARGWIAVGDERLAVVPVAALRALASRAGRPPVPHAASGLRGNPRVPHTPDQ